MASVYIENTEKRQIEGTTLLKLQSSFPNCWLTRCEDGVEIRVPAYVLESGKIYILNTASQPDPRASVTFESLLVASGYKQSDIDAKVVQRTKSRSYPFGERLWEVLRYHAASANHCGAHVWNNGVESDRVVGPNRLRFGALARERIVHKDVKSANICLDHNGDFVLIDLGDTVQVGLKSASTPEFVPADIDAAEGAAFAIDWWMLAMTVYDRMQPAGKGLRTQVGGQQLTTTSLLAWFHEGWRLDFGHYYLLAREQSRCGDSLEEQWVQLNDHVVQRGITAEQADLFASKGAYMIFYTKAKSKADKPRLG
eukprot:gene34976-45265_t